MTLRSLKSIVQYTLYFLFLISCKTLTSQSAVPEKLPVLLINEVHNEDYLNDDVYIELVVMKANEIAHNPTDTSPKIIIDDTNVGSGLEPGFLAIKPEAIAHLQPGDIVVIHGSNTDVSGAPPTTLLLDINNPNLEKYEGSPNSSNSSYQGATLVTDPGQNMKDYISFTGPGDKIQARINEVYVNKVDLTNAKNHSLSTDGVTQYDPLTGTLGGPNCDPNEDFITDLTNSGEYEIECEVFGNDVQVTVINGQSPYFIETPNYDIFSISTDNFTVNELENCGSNTIYVTDQSGEGLITDCTVTIGLSDVIELSVCSQHEIQIQEILCPISNTTCINYSQGTVNGTVGDIHSLPIFNTTDELIVITFSDGQGNVLKEVQIFLINKEGEVCDDNNICTFNDRVDSDCNCVGESDLMVELNVEKEANCEEPISILSVPEIYDGYRWELNGIYYSGGPRFETSLSGLLEITVYDGECSVSQSYQLKNYSSSSVRIEASSNKICPKEPVDLSITIANQLEIRWYDEFGNLINRDSKNIEVFREGLYRVEIGPEDCYEFGEILLENSYYEDWKIHTDNSSICTGDFASLSLEPELNLETVKSITWAKFNSAQDRWENFNDNLTEVTVDLPGLYSVRIQTDMDCEVYDQVEIYDNLDLASIEEFLFSSGFILSEWELPSSFGGNELCITRSNNCDLIDEIKASVPLQPLSGSPQHNFASLQCYYNQILLSQCNNCNNRYGGLISELTCDPEFDLQEFVMTDGGYERGVHKSLVIKDEVNKVLKVYSKFLDIDPMCINPYDDYQNLLALEIIKDLICALKEGADELTFNYNKDILASAPSFQATNFYAGDLNPIDNKEKEYETIDFINFYNKATISIKDFNTEVTTDFCVNKMILESILVPKWTTSTTSVSYYSQCKSGRYRFFEFPYLGGSEVFTILIPESEGYEFESLLERRLTEEEQANFVEKIGLPIINGLEVSSIDFLREIPSCLFDDLCAVTKALALRPAISQYSDAIDFARFISTNEQSTAQEIYECIFNDGNNEVECLLIDDIWRNYGYDEDVFNSLIKLYFTLDKDAEFFENNPLPDFETANIWLSDPINIDRAAFIQLRMNREYENNFKNQYVNTKYGYSQTEITHQCEFSIETDTKMIWDIDDNFDYYGTYPVRVLDKSISLPDNSPIDFHILPGIAIPYLAHVSSENINQKALENIRDIALFIFAGPELLAARAGMLTRLQSLFAYTTAVADISHLFLNQEIVCEHIGQEWCNTFKSISSVFVLAAVSGQLVTTIADHRNLQYFVNLSKSEAGNAAFQNRVKNMLSPRAYLEYQRLIQNYEGLEVLRKLVDEYDAITDIEKLVNDLYLNLVSNSNKLGTCNVEALLAMLFNPKIKSQILKPGFNAGQFFIDLANTAGSPGKLGAALGDMTEGWVKAWDIVKHLDEGVRLNVNALGKLDNLLTSGKIPKAKLESALNSHLGDILNAADEVNVGNILDRLNLQHVNEAHFDEILIRLDKYADVKSEIITNPSQFEFLDEVLKFPENYRELAQIGDIPTSSPLYQWALGKYRKQILHNAGILEEQVSASIGSYVNIPNGYSTATQVHLKGAKRTVPDDFIYKTVSETDPNTGIVYNRAIVHDTKLHQDVDWTTNQYNEIIKKFEDGASFIDLELRTAVSGLNIGDNIRIFKADVYKSIGTPDKSGTYLSTNPVF